MPQPAEEGRAQKGFGRRRAIDATDEYARKLYIPDPDPANRQAVAADGGA